MNNNHKKRKNYTRKVILLKYKDATERLVLTQTVEKRRESLIIKIQFNTQSVNKVRKAATQNERYPIFRAQLEDRIVPQCLRDKCRRNVLYKTKGCKRHKQRKTKHKSKNVDKDDKNDSASIITISDDECGGLVYEDISSCTDDEIDTLLESTRKRMKDSDKEWELLPRRCSMNDDLDKDNNYNSATRSLSLNSLDTLVLGDMEKIGLTTPILNQQYSPITSPEEKPKLEPLENSHSSVKRRLIYEPIQSIKYEECLHKSEDESNTKKKIKLESLDTNNGGEKHYYDSNQNDLQNGNLQKNEIDKLAYTVCPKSEVINKQKIIKLEPLETNNKITYQTCDVSIEDKKIYEIDSVITKLERNETMLNHNLINIKQELYSDIS